MKRALLILGGIAIAASNAHADCIDDAAAYHGVNGLVLRAIAWRESRMNPTAVHRNANGTFDIGLLQTNSIHLPELARKGIAPESLQNACVSAYVGAWHLAAKMRKFGNTWTAVGAYHSETPMYRDAYAREIYRIVSYWTSGSAAPAR